MTRERLVTAASSVSGVSLNPVSSVLGTRTARPSASWICSGYETQYGVGSSTSSPGSTSAMKAKYRLALAPEETRIWSGAYSTPRVRTSCRDIACRSSGAPAFGVYRVLSCSMARMPACLTASGVGKSGCPALKSSTSTPEARRLCARALIRNVGDNPIRSTLRETTITPSPCGPYPDLARLNSRNSRS